MEAGKHAANRLRGESSRRDGGGNHLGTASKRAPFIGI
jgi:hypothetical protein